MLSSEWDRRSQPLPVVPNSSRTQIFGDSGHPLDCSAVIMDDSRSAQMCRYRLTLTAVDASLISMLQPIPHMYPTVATRADLVASGFSSRQITSEVKSGRLIRPRRDRYVPAGSPPDLVAAVRAGGKVTCTSALAAAGIWVQDASRVHVHLHRGSSRVRDPLSGKPVVASAPLRNFTLHWKPLAAPDHASSASIGIIDAMIHAVVCQPPDFAVASLDSAVRFGLITPMQLDVVFFHVPARLHHLRQQIDSRSESILETLFRLQLRRLRLPYALQVEFRGVGRVDFVIAGRVIVETDGASFHGEPTAARDYDRDLKLVALGYLVIRLNYRQVVFEPEAVMAAVRMAVASHRPVRAHRS